MRNLESNHLRRTQLRAVGGQCDVVFDDGPPVLGLYTEDPQAVGFDDVQVMTRAPTLFMLTCDAERLKVAAGQRVTVPGQARQFRVARPPDDDAGITIVALRVV